MASVNDTGLTVGLTTLAWLDPRTGISDSTIFRASGKEIFRVNFTLSISVSQTLHSLELAEGHSAHLTHLVGFLHNVSQCVAGSPHFEHTGCFYIYLHDDHTVGTGSSEADLVCKRQQ